MKHTAVVAVLSEVTVSDQFFDEYTTGSSRFFHIDVFLWPPCVVDADIIFLPRGFYLLSFFYSSPNISGRKLDVYRTSTHDVALVRI